MSLGRGQKASSCPGHAKMLHCGDLYSEFPTEGQILNQLVLTSGYLLIWADWLKTGIS